MTSNITGPSTSYYQCHNPPYLESKEKASRSVNLLSITGLLGRNDILDNFIKILALIGGLFYFIFQPILDLLRCFVVDTACRKGDFSWCRSEGRSEGVISEFVCARTNRTYTTRFVDPDRDSTDCAQLLVSAFNVDPFTVHLQSNIAARHKFGAGWYKFFFESSAFDCIVQEWKEEEKIVGVLVYSQRKSSFLQSLIDYSKWGAQAIRFLFVSPWATYNQLLMSIAMEQKFQHVCKALKLNNVIHAKFLGVEKGFQGQVSVTTMISSLHSMEHYYISLSKILLSYLCTVIGL